MIIIINKKTLIVFILMGIVMQTHPYFQLSSPAFNHQTTIPTRHTCDGENISPHLMWQNWPPHTQSFALICDDPDAPREMPFVHWVIYNIPAHIHYLSEHQPNKDRLSEDIYQGPNDTKSAGYYGPCPPAGKPHRYIFTLYALDTTFTEKNMTKEQLIAAMNEHILAHTMLIGLYGRSK